MNNDKGLNEHVIKKEAWTYIYTLLNRIFHDKNTYVIFGCSVQCNKGDIKIVFVVNKCRMLHQSQLLIPEPSCHAETSVSQQSWLSTISLQKLDCVV